MSNDSLTLAMQTIAADVVALERSRTVPFVDASGTSNPVTLNAAGEIPFYDAAGTANNVKVTA